MSYVRRPGRPVGQPHPPPCSRRRCRSVVVIVLTHDWVREGAGRVAGGGGVWRRGSGGLRAGRGGRRGRRCRAGMGQYGADPTRRMVARRTPHGRAQQVEPDEHASNHGPCGAVQCSAVQLVRQSVAASASDHRVHYDHRGVRCGAAAASDSDSMPAVPVAAAETSTSGSGRPAGAAPSGA